jgi:hypothetical protein
VDMSGNIGLGYSVGSKILPAGIRYTGTRVSMPKKAFGKLDSGVSRFKDVALKISSSQERVNEKKLLLEVMRVTVRQMRVLWESTPRPLLRRSLIAGHCCI